MKKTKRKNVKRGGNKLKKSKNSKKKIMRGGMPPYHEEMVLEQGRGAIHHVSLINADGHPGVYVYDIYNPSKPIIDRHGRKDSFPPMSIYKIPVDVYNSITDIKNPHRIAFKPITGGLLDEYRSGYWTIIFAATGEQGHPQISYYAVNSRHVVEDGGAAANKITRMAADDERLKSVDRNMKELETNLHLLYRHIEAYCQRLSPFKALAITPEIVAPYLLDLYFPLRDIVQIYEDVLRDIGQLRELTSIDMRELITNPKYRPTIQKLQIHPGIISKYPQLRLS